MVDLSVMISGPLAAMMLADQGAEVVKVESPGLGDLMRFLGSSKGGMTGIFVGNNRGKRSLVVDLKQPDGLDVLRRLVADADVLIQNFRPGAMERLGLGYDDVAAINPGLVYVSISGYGPDGPTSHRRVYDNVIQAASGLASVQVRPDDRHPVAVPHAAVRQGHLVHRRPGDHRGAASHATAGAAGGQHIVLAMLDAAIAFMWPDSAMDATLLDDDVSRTPTIGSNYSVTAAGRRLRQCRRGQRQQSSAGCVAAFGHPEIADDPRFSSLPARARGTCPRCCR